MSQQPEQEALQRAVKDIGYLHGEFSVEVTNADEGEAGDPIYETEIVIVRNELSKARQTYRSGRQQAWLDAFRRDLTAGAFN